MKLRNVVNVVIVFACLEALNGCTGNREMIKAMGTSTRRDIFQEVPDGTAPVAGYADLWIYSRLKTHDPGLYSGEDIHGTARYAVLINIDGQACELQGVTGREKSALECMDGPEDGKGVRYTFSKKLRVRAGLHRISVAIPCDDVVVEREINVVEKTSNSLILQPDYRRIAGGRPGFLQKTSFKEGIGSLRIKLNGQEL